METIPKPEYSKKEYDTLFGIITTHRAGMLSIAKVYKNAFGGYSIDCLVYKLKKEYEKHKTQEDANSFVEDIIYPHFISKIADTFNE